MLVVDAADSGADSRGPGSRRLAPVLAACLLLTVVLGLHAWRYWFLCDDAFISFRYARNLALGHGLVFNPGFERVEGYSNFLWVILLAGTQLIGVAPEAAANPLSLICGIALFWLVIAHCLRELPRGASPWWVLVPAVLLACNRSYAVWCTSGLETKLFELLVVAGVLGSIREIRAMAAFRAGFPWSALWFAGAALTRPDGALFAVCVVGARVAFQWAGGTIQWRAFWKGVLLFLMPVGGHLIFRGLYYHDIFPNTYYAKVGGQSWWSMGGRYLSCFALEYFAVLWLPLVIVGVVRLVRTGRAEIPLLIGAAIIPHALYVAAIGGDHFEYRPVDVYLPLIFVLVFHALARSYRATATAAAAGAYVGLCAALGLLLPEMSRRDFPLGYRTGFPGLMPRDDYRTELIDSIQRRWVFEIPGLKQYAILYNDLIYAMTRQFVGIRQEEHAGFLATAIKQGRWLRELVAAGVLPADLHIAVDCVGAIPYVSGLRTLDRLGLTDAVVARQKEMAHAHRVMAHDKLAAPDYVRSIGVDLAGADNLHLVLPAGHPRLLHQAIVSKVENRPVVYADLGDGRFIMGEAVQGLDTLRLRIPGLKWLDQDQYVALVMQRDGTPCRVVPSDAQFGPPYDLVYFDQGVSLSEKGELAGALTEFDCALAANPGNAMAKVNAENLRRYLRERADKGRAWGSPASKGEAACQSHVPD